MEIRLGLLKIGNVAPVEAHANITPRLGLRLLQESPLSATMFASLNFGPARLVVRGFINGTLEMMTEVKMKRRRSTTPLAAC